MSESCIVCLCDLPRAVEVALEHSDPNSTAPASESGSHAQSQENEEGSSVRSPSDEITNPFDSVKLDTIVPSIEESSSCPPKDQLIAELIPCGHCLHNECLKPWVERANSCPICRANFNVVALHHEIGGAVISSYNVEDKRQVADLDPAMIIEFERADQEEYEESGECDDECMMCGTSEDHEMMFCMGCNMPCHVACAGLALYPANDWFCFHCAEHDAQARRWSRQHIRRRARRTVSSSRHRSASRDLPVSRPVDLAWESVWQSVINGQDGDSEIPPDDDLISISIAPSDSFWRRRLEIAGRQGASRRFRPITPAPPPRLDRETREEELAWSTFDRTRDGANAGDAEVGTSAAPRGRKRDASPASDAGESRQPERQLKRPRTRRTLDPNDVTILPQVGPSTMTNDQSPPPILEPSVQSPDGPASTFLQSLLQEVESTAALTGGEGQNRPSSKETPADSSRPTNLAMTPPHSPPLRPTSTIPLSSVISPLSPPILLTRPDCSRRLPGTGRESNARLNVLPSPPPRNEAPSSPLCGKEPALPVDSGDLIETNSPGSSPQSRTASLTYSTKSELQKMVSSVMRPIYRGGFITKEDYTNVNRDISRRLYDIVSKGGGSTFLADVTARRRLQQEAEKEVESVLGDKYRYYVLAKAGPLSLEDSPTLPVQEHLPST